jgi:hypothetical protein
MSIMNRAVPMLPFNVVDYWPKVEMNAQNQLWRCGCEIAEERQCDGQ